MLVNIFKKLAHSFRTFFRRVVFPLDVSQHFQVTCALDIPFSFRHPSFCVLPLVLQLILAICILLSMFYSFLYIKFLINWDNLIALGVLGQIHVDKSTPSGVMQTMWMIFHLRFTKTPNRLWMWLVKLQDVIIAYLSGILSANKCYPRLK